MYVSVDCLWKPDSQRKNKELQSFSCSIFSFCPWMRLPRERVSFVLGAKFSLSIRTGGGRPAGEESSNLFNVFEALKHPAEPSSKTFRASRSSANQPVALPARFVSRANLFQ